MINLYDFTTPDFEDTSGVSNDISTPSSLIFSIRTFLGDANIISFYCILLNTPSEPNPLPLIISATSVSKPSSTVDGCKA